MPYAFLTNPALDRTRKFGVEEQQIQSLDGARVAFETITAWPGYAPTPLLALTDMARELGVGDILYKHEAHRFGLKSFKALGGAYAVQRLVAARGGSTGLVVTSATDGNHGRSVAWGAQRLGIHAIIFIHATVSQGRADAIAAYGADVRRVPGNYDDAVRAAAEAADANGWVVVSDTSWPGYETIPKDVMQGYAVMPWECEAQGAHPTHVFVQGGVGGLAAAVLAYEWQRLGADRPLVIVVEPDHAACLFESAKAGAIVTIPGDLDTIMAGLACGEPSLLAWRLLQPGIDAFVTITDADAAEAMRLLADQQIAAGESGVAGLAGLRCIMSDADARRQLKLDQRSRVLCYGTEGATDPAVYERIVGRSASDVEAVV